MMKCNTELFPLIFITDLRCLPPDVHSGVVDFNPGGRFHLTGVDTVVVVLLEVGVVVEGDMEVTPHFGGLQDFNEDRIEDVAFEEVGLPMEGTVE